MFTSISLFSRACRTHRICGFKLLITIVFTVFFVNCNRNESKPPTEKSGLRIISFAPSITEALFALSLGKNVVGVTQFCKYPSEATTLPKIGGLLNPNFEMILSLKPNLAILLNQHSGCKDFLDKQGIRSIIVNNENVDGILQSFKDIAALCEVKSRGDSLVQAIKDEFVKDSSLHLSKHPRVLICIGRDNPGSGSISKAYVAGVKTFYNELLIASGGENAYTDSIFGYSSLSVEGILSCSPDIIIDLMTPAGNCSVEKLVSDWQILNSLAVKNKQVYSMTDEYMTIPGPRIQLIVRNFKKIIRSWQESQKG